MKGVGADAPYWEALSSGKLMLPRCADCGHWSWPAAYRCGRCGSWEHEWREQLMEGKIFSWTRTWHDFGASPSFELPFLSVVVQLSGESGIRLLGTLRKGEAAIGMAVTGTAGVIQFQERKIPSIEWQVLNDE